MGSARAELRYYGDARRRPDGCRNDAGSGNATDRQAVHHAEARDGSQDHPEGAGPEGHHPEGGGPQGIDPEADHGSEGRGSEVARSEEGHRAEVHEARGGREEGRGGEEAEDRPRSQGIDPEADHDPEGHSSEIARSQEGHGAEVHEARGGREEGRGDEEAEDRPRPQGSFAERSVTETDMGRSDEAERDAGERETSGTSEYVGDSPGESFGLPDEPVAADQPGTTAEEHGERSLDRRLAMDEPDASPSEPAGSETSAHTILDDDVATEDAVPEDPDADPEEADLDRTREEVAEQSSDPPESAEESAMHIERE
jgi:hypothetical protein